MINNEPLLVVDISRRVWKEFRQIKEMTDDSIANDLNDFFLDLLKKILRIKPEESISFKEITVITLLI
jgi:hypothetical protein